MRSFQLKAGAGNNCIFFRDNMLQKRNTGKMYRLPFFSRSQRTRAGSSDMYRGAIAQNTALKPLLCRHIYSTGSYQASSANNNMLLEKASYPGKTCMSLP